MNFPETELLFMMPCSTLDKPLMPSPTLARPLMPSPTLARHAPLMRLCSFNDNSQKEDPRFSRIVTAASNSDLIQIRIVITEEKLPVNYQETARGNRSALHYVTKYHFIEGVKTLLKYGADCNCMDINGLTPLMMAAAEGLHDIAKLLLEATAKVNLTDKKERTALHWAMTHAYESGIDRENNRVRLVKLLTLHGASPTAKDKDGRVPQHIAAQSGFVEGLKILLCGKGCGTVTARDSEQRTPLHLAVQGAKSLEVVTVLLDHGAHIDATDKHGQTALHLLANRNVTQVDEEFDIACLDILIHRGASVHLLDENKRNPLTLTLNRTMWYNKGSSRDFLLTIVQMLVAKGSQIRCCFTMWRMIESFPSLLSQTLNHSLTTNTSVVNSKYLVLEFDFSGLIINDITEDLHTQSKFCQPHDAVVLPPSLTAATDISILHYLIVTGNKQILSHPLCRTFLHLKWIKIRKYFVINFIFNCFFVLSISSYVFLMTSCDSKSLKINQGIFSGNDSEIGTDLSSPRQQSETDFSTAENEWTQCMQDNLNTEKLVSWITLSILYIVILIREMIQFGHNPLQYIFMFKRVLMSSLLIMIPIIVIKPCQCEDIWRKQIAAVIVVNSWISLLLSLGQFPAFGVYIVMFSTVAKNVLKFLGLYMLLLIAFAFGFHVLLRPYSTFSTLFTSFSTTLVSIIVGYIYLKCLILRVTRC